MEGEDFSRHYDKESRQQVGPVLQRHSEIKSQDECKDSGDGEYGELNGAHYPARVMSKMADGAMDIKW
jgi:hypothetical protein